MLHRGRIFLLTVLLVLSMTAWGQAGDTPVRRGKALAVEAPLPALGPSYAVSSYEELVDVMAQAMARREEEFSVTFLYGSPFGLLEEVNRAFEEDLACRAPYDYWHYQSARYSQVGNQVTINVFYRTTLEQEQELEAALRPIVDAWRDLPADQQVEAVHDWIVNNLSYDQTYSRYTAYEAFFDQSAVCQGYSLLAYKMLALLGVPVGIVTGQGNGGPHMWNMVQLCCGGDCQWFHVDTTWDDPLPGGFLLHDYFLVSDATITRDHLIENACGRKAPYDYDAWSASCTEGGPGEGVDWMDPVVSVGASVFRPGDELVVSLSLYFGGSSVPGDYFLWAQIPGGTCYCYRHSGGWRACPCSAPTPAYQGPIVAFSDLVVARLAAASLPPGSYTLTFAVDDRADGSLAPDAARSTARFEVQAP